MNNCKVPLPNCIDGISGAGIIITELWRSRFCNLLNCIIIIIILYFRREGTTYILSIV